MTKKKKNENYQKLAMATGMHYDETNGVMHGQRDGFDFLMYPTDDSHPLVMELHTAAKSADGSPLTWMRSSSSVRAKGWLLRL